VGEDYIVGLVMEKIEKIQKIIKNEKTKNISYTSLSGVFDPVRLFVKREPHKEQKAREGRWRLIWSFSIVDMLIQSLTYEESNQAEIDNCYDIPSKPGFSFLHGGMNKVYSYLEDGRQLECAEKDHSGWDMHVPEWLFDMEWQFRARQCDNLDDDREMWLQAVTKLIARSDVVFSDGSVFRQQQPGIMKSGTKITISMNSHGQIFNKILFCLEECGGFDWDKHAVMAQGDDTIERVVGVDKEAFKAWFVRAGFLLKHVHFGSVKDLEFCSHRFLDVGGTMVAFPVNWSKQLFNIMYKEKKKMQFLTEQLFSMCILYAWDNIASGASDRFPALFENLRRSGPEMCRSRRWFQSLHTGWESAAQSAFSVNSSTVTNPDT